VRIDDIKSSGRLDLPPPAGARLRLPDSFGQRFAMFGDAEEEFDWNGPFRREAISTLTIAALPEANRRFKETGLEPCWMVDWPVVDNPESGAVVRDLVAQGACAVGTQLHPWVSPPFEEEISRRNSYTSNLPVALQREKLLRLTDRIEAAVGVRPTVYRAGRYGVGPHTAAILAELGYVLDVSVRSRFDYRSQRGPNFSSHPQWPYRVARDLYELPLTTAYTGLLNRWPGFYRAESLRGTLARTGLLARVPLTPEGVPLADALEAIDVLLGEGHQLFSLSFHTPSLVPGHTPYVRDAADLAKFWHWWDGVFDRFAARGVTPVGASELIAAFRAARQST